MVHRRPAERRFEPCTVKPTTRQLSLSRLADQVSLSTNS